jgi:3-oxoacyl-[acyl-carrier protein] reductase
MTSVHDAPAEVQGSAHRRTALVTAAGGGMGRAVVGRLLLDGLQVIASDVSNSRLEALAEAPPGEGRLAARIRTDITNLDGCRSLVEQATQQAGRIDVLVNIAGGYRGELIEPMIQLPLERITSAYELSLRSVIVMTQLCAPMMVEAGWGRIVNVASVAMNGSPGQADYAAMKAGVVGFTKTCAMELAPDVTANAVVPGVIETSIVDRLDPDLLNQYLDRIPMKRVGQPHEVAGVVSFLASDDASYVTGEDLYVAGGFKSW